MVRNLMWEGLPRRETPRVLRDEGRPRVLYVGLDSSRKRLDFDVRTALKNRVLSVPETQVTRRSQPQIFSARAGVARARVRVVSGSRRLWCAGCGAGGG